MLPIVYSSMRARRCVFCLALLLLVAGCGGSTATVSGKVTYNGKPIPAGSTITFLNTDASGAATTVRDGRIDEGGTYSVSKVGVGPAKITIRGYLPKFRLSSKEEEQRKRHGIPVPMPKAGEDPKDFPRLPARYEFLDKTPLTFEVKSGSNEFNVEMTDK
jgi:hypothetical protein